jgi:hypothetical protein
MEIFREVKCARCSIHLQASGEILSCPRCGVTDSRVAVMQEITQQLHDWRARNLQNKVRRILRQLKEVPRMPITGRPCRFVYEAGDESATEPDIQPEQPHQ